MKNIFKSELDKLITAKMIEQHQSSSFTENLGLFYKLKYIYYNTYNI